MAKENRSWGYDRIAGALTNLGHEVSDQTVGNVLRRGGIPPAPERKRTTTWAEFNRVHLAVLGGTAPKSGVQSERIQHVCHNERLTGCQNGENTTG